MRHVSTIRRVRRSGWLLVGTNMRLLRCPAMDKLKEPGFWVAIVLGLAPILTSAAVLLWVQS
jgi:hypothetical protein